jgi:hypothetical protein
MTNRRTGLVLAVSGALCLIALSWLASWWYVPVLRGGSSIATPVGGPVLFVVWAGSGVLGAVLVAVGAFLFADVGWRRVLLLALGSAVLLTWMVVWTTASHQPVLFGAGGGLILLFFLWSCWDWVRTRRESQVPALALDLRLAGNACFFVAAWGLCGLLGAPVFLLRPDMTEAAKSSAASTLATKVLLSLVLGWGFVAASHRVERVRGIQ